MDLPRRICDSDACQCGVHPRSSHGYDLHRLQASSCSEYKRQPDRGVLLPVNPQHETVYFCVSPGLYGRFRNAVFITARSELRKVLFLALSVAFFVCV